MSSDKTPASDATTLPAEPAVPVAAAPPPSIILNLGDGLVVSISGGTLARQTALIRAAMAACPPRPPKRSAAEAEIEEEEKEQEREDEDKPKKKKRRSKASRAKSIARAIAHNERKEGEKSKEQSEEVAKVEDTEG